MSDVLTPDICVVGAGAAGLTVAAGAAAFGVSVVLIEKHRMGGDCLNTGCVPSKALLAAARAAQGMRTAGRFGVTGPEPAIDFAAVHAHVHRTIAAIAPHDSQERFEGLGVRVIRAPARFVDAGTVEAGGVRIRARRFVLATGSRPLAPPIPGLDSVPYLTNETVFERTTAPGHLIVLGGGPIGVEMAQAHRRLGARVTVVEKQSLLPKDDPELVEVVRHRLTAEGVDLIEGTGVASVGRAGDGVAGVLEDGRRIEGSDLLVAAGRRANVEGLGMEAAGIETTKGGVTVDARLRTTNRRVYAVGDVTGGPAFTHMAGFQAGIVVRNALFRWPARADRTAVPWVTYSDPELAHVGLTEAQARERHGDVRVLRAPFAENDRARAEGAAEGLAKVVALPGGRILGASIVGAHAGEQIALWCLALSKGMRVHDVAGLLLPYPTLAEAGKRAAGAFFTPVLFGPRTRLLVRFLSWFG
ncbi:dihydrolipoyl dehydrogenase family protein [Azospirillum sp.]|uniref:dihydrolipoyl dehydrogenase family protein n=1 Tax=Azospirillum sp. TaxID=34012 RepID=UPI002D388752|nr:FAD-dependent oxidoreductase [Azospirillum sp.]HYD66934.1 FAD-dependent oxidoreductase [Azospirillum sp.]